MKRTQFAALICAIYELTAVVRHDTVWPLIFGFASALFLLISPLERESRSR